MRDPYLLDFWMEKTVLPWQTLKYKESEGEIPGDFFKKGNAWFVELFFSSQYMEKFQFQILSKCFVHINIWMGFFQLINL